MAMLRQYKILLAVIIGVVILMLLYSIWVTDKIIDDMIIELLKSAEYGQYIWN